MKKIVSVRFDDSFNHKAYQFYTDIEDLQPGEKLVVKTVNGLSIVTVNEYSDSVNPGIKNMKWVVQRINLEKFEERERKERKLAFIKKKMDARRKQIEETSIFAMLSKDDPEMKIMYDEFLQLSSEEN